MLNRRMMTLMICLLAGWISACSAPLPTGGGQIQFSEIFESRRNNEMQIEKTAILDFDGDADNEWLVLYRFDTTDESGWNSSPIQAFAYDAVSCDPPIIQNLSLPFPNNDYLSEGNSSSNDSISAYMADWLAGADGEEESKNQELIINGPGEVNTLSIYRYKHTNLDPCAKPNAIQEGFDLLGFFRSNGPIEHDDATGEITTYQRSSHDRSQLAIRNTYVPTTLANKSQTFISSGESTKGPSEQSIDFLYGIPSSPMDSPYPEKAVAAFYLSIGTEAEGSHSNAIQYLEKPPAFDDFEKFPGWGLGVAPSKIQKVLIHSIAYAPDREAERAHQPREVTVVIVVVDENGNQLAPRRVRIRLKGIPIEDQPDCEWRLESIIDVAVTPGLG